MHPVARDKAWLDLGESIVQRCGNHTEEHFMNNKHLECESIETATAFCKPFVYLSHRVSPCDTYASHSYLSLSPSLRVHVSICFFFLWFLNRYTRQLWCSIKRFDYFKRLIITVLTPLFGFRWFFFAINWLFGLTFPYICLIKRSAGIQF